MSATTTSPSGALSLRRVVAFAVATATAVTLGVGAGLVVATDVAASGEASLAGASGTVVLETYGANGTLVQPYDHGDEVSLRFTLENGGPLPIVVEHIDALTEHLGLLTPTAVTVSGSVLPVRLAAGEGAVVDVRARFDNCEYYTERALERHTHATVGWSVLGVDRTSQVAYGHDLLVRSPTIVGGCSDRVMDRSAKQRSMEASPTGRG